jgi:adenylate cyclase
MSDVFISYARSTAKQANAAAEALRGLGYSVWLDDELLAHHAYTHAIEEQLTAAKVALVIWSAEAVKSEWVLSEANRAREDYKLVQLTVDGARLPMPFDQTQCADLRDWNGDANAPGWRKVVASIADLVGGTPAETAPAAAPLGKPSIAVLPFTDMTGAGGDDYFADGMVEEIATALSRFPSLFVNASGSNAAYRERARNLKAIGQELGVRYLLEGSVRKAGGAVRISVKLVDAADGAQLWAERFDGTLEDVFALQDTVANAAASQIEPNIEAAEIRRAGARPTQDLGAYDLWLRAVHLQRSFEKDALLAACALLERAIARDPDYALALGSASFCRSLLLPMGFSDDQEGDRRKSLDLAQRALRNGGDDPQVLAWVSAAIVHAGGDAAAAHAMMDRALQRNPGSSFTWYFSGWLNVYSGRFLAAVEHFDRSLRLDPRTPDRANILNGLAWAVVGLHRFEEAIGLHREAAQLLSNHEGPRIGLIVSYAHLGRIDEAKAVLRTVHAATIETMIGAFRDPDLIALTRSGVALAGADV